MGTCRLPFDHGGDVVVGDPVTVLDRVDVDLGHRVHPRPAHHVNGDARSHGVGPHDGVGQCRGGVVGAEPAAVVREVADDLHPLPAVTGLLVDSVAQRRFGDGARQAREVAAGRGDETAGGEHARATGVRAEAPRCARRAARLSHQQDAGVEMGPGAGAHALVVTRTVTGRAGQHQMSVDIDQTRHDPAAVDDIAGAGCSSNVMRPPATNTSRCTPSGRTAPRRWSVPRSTRAVGALALGTRAAGRA